MDKTALQELGQFCGTVDYHRFTNSMVLTDGVKHLIENADCYWLLNSIASYQGMLKKDAALQDIQFWTLRPYPKEGKPELKSVGKLWSNMKASNEERPAAYITCERDTGDVAIIQEVEVTDFPFDVLSEVKIWLEPTMMGGRLTMVALLSSEH